MNTASPEQMNWELTCNNTGGDGVSSKTPLVVVSFLALS